MGAAFVFSHAINERAACETGNKAPARARESNSLLGIKLCKPSRF